MVDDNSNNAPNKPIKDDKPAEDDVYKRLNAFRPAESVLKKHPCKDCFNCLFCSDARCAVCLQSKCCQNTCKQELKE